MYKLAGKFLQALVRRARQPPRSWPPLPPRRRDPPKPDYDARKAQSRLVKRLDKEVGKVAASAKADFDTPNAQSGLVKRREDDAAPKSDELKTARTPPKGMTRKQWYDAQAMASKAGSTIVTEEQRRPVDKAAHTRSVTARQRRGRKP